MYCEITSTGKFALQDLTLAEIEIIHESLIVLKDQKVIQTKDFEEERQVMTEMYIKIDAELIRSRMPSG